MELRGRRLLAGAVVLASLNLATSSHEASAGRHDDFVRVGYFIQWGIYGRNFVVQDLRQRQRRETDPHQLRLRQRRTERRR